MTALPTKKYAADPSPENAASQAASEYSSTSREGNIWQEQAAAREAIRRQEFVKTQTSKTGFVVEDYWKIDTETATHSLKASQGEVTERYDVEMSREVANRVLGHDSQTIAARTQIGFSKLGLAAPAPIRFPCGDRWYTLSRPLVPETLAELAKDLGLAATATTNQIERNLHFQFQRLYRKPPDEWTESDALQWHSLESHVDLEAYEVENPVPDSRIGVLVSISADLAVVQWNTEGETVYDTRHLPTALLAASAGWIVHAMIQRTAAGEQKWISAWAELPVKSDNQVIEEDIASREVVSLDQVPDAKWPRTPWVDWRRLTKRMYEALRKLTSK